MVLNKVDHSFHDVKCKSEKLHSIFAEAFFLDVSIEAQYADDSHHQNVTTCLVHRGSTDFLLLLQIFSGGV